MSVWATMKLKLQLIVTSQRMRNSSSVFDPSPSEGEEGSSGDHAWEPLGDLTLKVQAWILAAKLGGDLDCFLHSLHSATNQLGMEPTFYLFIDVH